MNERLNRVLLAFLRLLIYGKRAVVWAFHRVMGISTVFGSIYRQTLGFRIYKVWFQIGRRWQPLRLAMSGHFIDAFGTRGVLQALLFALILVVTLPHSKLYTRTSPTVAGHDTLLYALLGPGEEDVEIEEVGSRQNTSLAVASAWREGAVGVTVGDGGAEVSNGLQELGSISTGGSAITKPTIISGGASAGTQIFVTERTAIDSYTVQPGDVIGGIAGRYGVSVNTILWANNLTERSYIRPGDVLKILPKSGITHVVVKGNTLSSIANRYDVAPAVIIAANHLESDGRDIIVGEELMIPDGVKPTPIYTPAPVKRNPTFNAIAAPVPSVTAPAGSNYVWPAGVHYISQYFGLNHTGIDIAGPIGTPVYAAAAGVVITAQCGYNGGYGCYIIIDHGGGVNTLYGHNSLLLVSVGDAVTQGQNIALMGSTGHSSGPHVHFEVRVNKKFQNPLRYVR